MVPAARVQLSRAGGQAVCFLEALCTEVRHAQRSKEVGGFHFSVCHLLTSSHTSSMKRQREESWNCDTWERNRKMPLTLEHWHGCPRCGARNLSWSEWASYSTILNPVEQYDLCTTCLRKIMKKHWKMMYWWRWTGSGGLQEEFVTSPCMPIN